MKQRPLRSTDLTVSSLGLGTVKFGRNEQVKYPSEFDLPGDDEILALLDLAREEGINFLDTAPAYGVSEERLGRLLGGRREEWVLMSKAGEEFVGGESRFDFSPDAIRNSVERSLRRLKTDRIDCLLLHSDGNDLAILDECGAVESLRNLETEGKLLSIGISTKTVAGGLRAIELGLDAVMVTYNPWTREEEPVLDEASRAGTSILLKKALGSGWFGSRSSSSTGEAAPDPVEEALQFAFAHPATTSAVIGTINPRHLSANCAAMRRVDGDD